MEWLVWIVLFIFILACVLYFVVKAAVRDGMLAYDQIKRQEEQAGEQGQSQQMKKQMKKRMANCHPLSLFSFHAL